MSEEKKLTHSERLEELKGKGDQVKEAVDTLLKCKGDGNVKQVAYWVGMLSRHVDSLCRDCLGEELLKAMAEKERKIIRP